MPRPHSNRPGPERPALDRPAIERRAFLGSSALAGLSLLAPARSARAGVTDRDAAMTFAVTRSEADWRELLSETEYAILREGGTEIPRSSPLWDQTSDVEGTFACRGCDLVIYDAREKVVLPMGWVFFYHSRPTTTITDIDMGGPMPAPGTGPAIEAACRRCGSHLGHMIAINSEIVHCINGAGVKFDPTTA